VGRIFEYPGRGLALDLDIHYTGPPDFEATVNVRVEVEVRDHLL
jgi:hypothetical protein